MKAKTAVILIVVVASTALDRLGLDRDDHLNRLSSLPLTACPPGGGFHSGATRQTK